jgi:hypothetical protein
MYDFISNYLNSFVNDVEYLQQDDVENAKTPFFNSVYELLNNVIDNTTNTAKPNNKIAKYNNSVGLLGIYRYFQREVALNKIGHNKFLISKNIIFPELEVTQLQCPLEKALPIAQNHINIVNSVFKNSINNIELDVIDSTDLAKFIEMGYNKSLTDHFYKILNQTSIYDNDEIINFSNITLNHIQNKSQICRKNNIEFILKNEHEKQIKLFFIDQISNHCKEFFLDLMMSSYSYDKHSKTITNSLLPFLGNNVAIKKKYLTKLIKDKNFNELTYSAKCEHLKDVCNHNYKDKFCTFSDEINQYIKSKNFNECFRNNDQTSYLNYLSTLIQSDSILGTMLTVGITLFFKNTLPVTLKITFLSLYAISTYYAPEQTNLIIDISYKHYKYFDEKISPVISGLKNNIFHFSPLLTHISNILSENVDYYIKDLGKATTFIKEGLLPILAITFGKIAINYIVYSGANDNKHPSHVDNKIEAEKFVAKYPTCSIFSQNKLDNNFLYADFYDTTTGQDSNLFCPYDLDFG